jgi:uncharacterized protein YoaH (UPF0181 family)
MIARFSSGQNALALSAGACLQTVANATRAKHQQRNQPCAHEYDAERRNED